MTPRSRPHPTRRRLLALTLAGALALGAAACGGDDGDDDGDSGSGNPPTTESTSGGGSDDPDDPIAGSIAAQAEALGIEDTVDEGDSITIVMKSGATADDADAACTYTSGLLVAAGRDAELSVDRDGDVSPC